MNEKHYDKPERPVCPHCGDPLENGDDNIWYCLECDYDEENNLTVCRSGYCNGNIAFYEDMCCRVEHEDGPSCYEMARHEAEVMEEQARKLDEEIKNNPDHPARHYW